MSLLIIIGCIWGICKLISAASAASKERARQAELARVRAAQERQRAEQARMREEWKAAQAAERERVRKMVALEREQARQAKEQEWIAREQERQAVLLEKHEKRIASLELRMSQAEIDIQNEIANLDHFTAKLASLDEELRHAQWEVENWKAQRHLANVAKAEKKVEKIQDSIFVWEDKVRKAEKRMDKAQRTYAIAKNELAAA